MALENSQKLVDLIGLQRFYVESITSIMTETGKMWYNKEIGIAQEHMVTNYMKKIIQMYNHKIEMKGLIEGLAVICNPEGDDHNMSNLVLEGLLKIRNYRVTNIGGNWYMGEKMKATNKAIIDFAIHARPDIVFISVTIARYLFNAKIIAKAIDFERKKYPITKTSQLSKIIEHIYPERKKKIHPATKTFQAFRIFINKGRGPSHKSAMPLLVKLVRIQ